MFRPLLVCGPSGVGKGTILKHFLALYPNKFGFSVSSTTRKPRAGEVNGIHYNFLSMEQMKADIADGKFIEYANVHGNIYGTSLQAVEKIQQSRLHPIFDIDIQGAVSISKTKLNPLGIFINPPSFEQLEKRLRDRNTETPQSLEIRLENAKKEMIFAISSKLFHIIVNDNLDRCVKEFTDYVNKHL
jgi:guanylate kinase